MLDRGFPSNNDFSVFGNATDAHTGSPIGKRSGILHDECRICLCLEVDKIPFDGGMMGFHALNGVGIQSPTIDFVGLGRCLHGSSDQCSRPESMSHVAPWICRIGSVIGCAILSDLETGAFSCDSQVHNA